MPKKKGGSKKGKKAAKDQAALAALALRREQEEAARREQEEAIKAREELIAASEAALQKREEKMWEKSRQKRVQGWRSWSNGAGVVKNKIPRVKEERRADGTSGYNQGNDERGMGYRKDWR